MNGPKIKLETDISDQILNFVSLAFVLFAFYFPFSAYSNLPDSIPSHFDGTGQVDDYSSKSSVWFMPAISALTFVGLLILNRFPHVFNYTVEITAANAKTQYSLATRFIRWLSLIITCGLCYISYATVQSAQSTEGGLGSWFLPVFMGVLTLPVIIYLVRMSQLK